MPRIRVVEYPNRIPMVEVFVDGTPIDVVAVHRTGGGVISIDFEESDVSVEVAEAVGA